MLKIKNMYQYGSRAYGTAHINSDYDYVVILDTDNYENQILNGQYNYNVYGINTFRQKLLEHDISALECIFIDGAAIHQDIKFDLKINKQLLRHSLSQKSSLAWVKAKKKFTVEKDYAPYIGYKSIIHSLRIIDYGIQLAELNQILYPARYGRYLDLVSYNPDLGWEDYKAKLEPEYKKLLHEFRLLCPK